MAVRVLIEREVSGDKTLHIYEMLMRLRAEAMMAKGYISGETLRSRDNPNKFIVISTWNTIQDWEEWSRNPERLKLKEEIDGFLESREKVEVFVYS